MGSAVNSEYEGETHNHCLVLEGGFDEAGTFVSVPFSDVQAMTEIFRRRVIWLLVQKELLSDDFARNLLSWRNSGFSTTIQCESPMRRPRKVLQSTSHALRSH